jgi:hypothetical protein
MGIAMTNCNTDNVIPLTCEAQIVDDAYTLVEPGTYDLAFIRFETAFMFRHAPKVVLWFCIVTMGPAFGAEVPRFYNVKRIIGKPQKGGRFNVGRRSDFVREFTNLFHLPDKRLDRLPVESNFRNAIVSGEVKTVTRDFQQRELAEPIQYSVVKQLLKITGP